MIDKIKLFLTKYKVHVSVVGGALVIVTVFGQCTLEPSVEAIKDAVGLEVEEAVDNSEAAAETTTTETTTTEATTAEATTAEATNTEVATTEVATTEVAVGSNQ